MTDLRQGVSPAAHAVLDELERLRGEDGPLSPEQAWRTAKGRLAQAARTKGSATAARYTVQAAAQLIRAAELADAYHQRLGIELFPEGGQ